MIICPLDISGAARDPTYIVLQHADATTQQRPSRPIQIKINEVYIQWYDHFTGEPMGQKIVSYT